MWVCVVHVCGSVLVVGLQVCVCVPARFDGRMNTMGSVTQQKWKTKEGTRLVNGTKNKRMEIARYVYFSIHYVHCYG